MGPGRVRRALIVIVGLATATPMPAMAKRPPNLPLADAGFRAGQAQYDRGEYLAAARSWTKMAELIPEDAAHRGNRASLYEYIADAYQKALAAGATDEILQEALTVLGTYSTQYVAAYPGEPLPVRIAQPLDTIRIDLAEREAAKPPEPQPQPQPQPQPEPPVAPPAADVPAPTPAPAPAPVPTPKPWKGLAIGGGVSLGGAAILLGVAAAGLVRARSAEQDFNASCTLGDVSGACGDIDRRGRSANAMQLSGFIAAPVFVGVGVGLLVVAMKRRSAGASTLAPRFDRHSVGLVWQRAF